MTKKQHKIIAFSAFLTALFISLAFLHAKDQTNTEAAATDTFRVSEYYLAPGTFTGTNHTLTLNQNLTEDYFVIVQGSDGDASSNSDRGPDENYAALISDPFGTGDLINIGSANQIEIARNNAINSWVGVITVVECTSDCNESGFQLLDVERVVHSGSNTNGSDTSGTDWADIDQVMLMGGYNGSGCTTTQTSTANSKVCHVRLFPSGNNTLEWTRNNVGTTLTSSTSTVMVLEWGGEWNIQRASATGTAGGNGANASNEYNTAPITTVDRANTWVWGTGHTTDQGIGDASEGTLITLGNGVDQNASESTVAIGQEYSDTKSYEVYTLSHPDLLVDYRFKTDGDSTSLSVDQTIDSANDSTARMALVTNGCNGTGNAYPRPMFSARYISDTSIRLERRRSGQNFPAWIQGIDFSNIVPGVDLSSSTKVDDDSDNSVIPNQTISYTITLSNNGTIDATGVDLIDTLDSNLENLSIQSLTSCGVAYVNNSTSNVVDIDNLSISTTTDCIINFTTNVKSGLIGGTNITNTANIGSSNEGSSPVILNSDILNVVTNTDLAITHTVSNNNPNKGDSITYTITVTNNGPENANGIFLFNLLPSGISYDNSLSSQGVYNNISGLWDIGSLSNTSNSTLNITVDIDEDVGAMVNNTATLTLSTPTDYFLGNNSSSISIDVIGGGSSGGTGRRVSLGEICGDGLQHITETCDDGNTLNEDGCDQYCQLEGIDTAETVIETTIIGDLISVCPHIGNAEVCRNLVAIFGDIFVNVRREQSALHAAADHQETCLNLDPNRDIQFIDLDPNDEANIFINFLKNTQIKGAGDYVFSGQGNHSSGKQVGEYQTGSWEFGALSPMTRAAAVKTILIANCIPIIEEVPNTGNLFKFTDIKRNYDNQDKESTFLSQIFYTAYQHGIVKGYQDGSAKPNKLVNHAEVIAMMIRAAEANPNKNEENSPNWYKNHFDFARSNGIYNGIVTDSNAQVTRRDFAKLMVRIMAFAKNPEIHSYIERVNIFDESYDEQLPTFTPNPIIPKGSCDLEVC
jgi:uncharacterized repeat protein (TIGR01451 family)